MIKQYAGYSGHILTKGIGAAIYTTFFCKVRTRMDDDIAVPFANRRNGYRVDRVDVHDALEEALANALAHAKLLWADEGILVVKKGKELSISNPGTIRVTKEEFYAGGNSDPRNPNILKNVWFCKCW